MVTVVPVIQELSSETKKSTSLAISSGAPNLFNNVVLFAFSQQYLDSQKPGRIPITKGCPQGLDKWHSL